MKGKKRYSNVTISKRVDHEAGRHRSRRAPAEPKVCRQCGALYLNRRWVTAQDALKLRKPERGPTTETLCEGCKRREQGVPSGFLYLNGAFLNTHRKEIDHFLNKEAERASHDNPTAQVMGRTLSEDGVLTITTTTEHLAQRLGEALEKAFGGKTTYDFSHENKLARVYWSKEAAASAAK